LVVTPSSIPIFATQVPDMELSPDKGSKEVLEDSDDESVIKMRVSDSYDAFDDEPDTKAMGTRFLLFLVHPFICLACYLLMQP